MLPIFVSDSKDLNMLQTRWASELNPIIASPISGSLLLKGVEISSGANTINHKLGRKLQGWVVCGMHGAYAQIYDNQQTNLMPDKTLLLQSSGATTIDLVVF